VRHVEGGNRSVSRELTSPSDRRGWNADGKGLSICDVYADTLEKIKKEDTGDVANGHFHRYSRMSRCKIESPRSSRNGGFVLAACRCWVGSGRVSTCGQTSEPQGNCER
jgi:Glycosyl hydrolase family 1